MSDHREFRRKSRLKIGAARDQRLAEVMELLAAMPSYERNELILSVTAMAGLPDAMIQIAETPASVRELFRRLLVLGLGEVIDSAMQRDQEAEGT